MATKTSNFVSLRVSLFILFLFVSSQVGAAEAKHLQELRRKLGSVGSSRSGHALGWLPPRLRFPPTRRVWPPRRRVPPPPHILSAPPPPLMLSAPPPPWMPSAPPPSHVLSPPHVSSLQPHMQHVPLPLPHASSPSSA